MKFDILRMCRIDGAMPTIRERCAAAIMKPVEVD
jgi:hypothetical protein